MRPATLIADLRSLTEGEVTDAPDALDAASVDYGRVVQRRPGVVVRPLHGREVARVLRYCSDHDLPISPQGAQHSFGGQGLNEGGLVLDLRRLRGVDRIDAAGGWFEAGAGTSWKEIVDAAIPQGLIPPVLTSYLHATIGGTHSSAGFGIASFRHGTHLDNCLELEVATLGGELVRCSLDQEPDLFLHALGGYGQFGVITRVRHRLRRFRRHVRTYFVWYDDLGDLLADQALLIAEDRVDFIDATASRWLQGTVVKEDRRMGLLNTTYPMNISVEADGPDAIRDDAILAGLRFRRHVHTDDISAAAFFTAGNQEEKVQRPRLCSPWMDFILPWPHVQPFAERALRHLPWPYASATMIVLWPARRDRMTRPMLRLPDTPLIMGFGLYATFAQPHLAPVLAAYRAFAAEALQHGSKLYLCGPMRPGPAELEAQFGDAWPDVQAAKRRHDPRMLLNPGFFPPRGDP